MKKLIDTYSKMESVTPAAIQLIFKGNPIAESDTPTKINLQNNDILEVCRVPGVQNSQMVTKSSIPGKNHNNNCSKTISFKISILYIDTQDQS